MKDKRGELDNDGDEIELYYEVPMYKLLQLEPKDRVVPCAGEIVVENIYKATSRRSNAFT